MVEPVLWIQSKLSLIHLKKFRMSLKSFFVGIWVLASSVLLIQCSICPSSVSSSLATTTDQYSFSGYTTTQTKGVAVGAVSKNLYYLHMLTSTSDNTAIIRENESGSNVWMSSFALKPNMKSLSVDSTEKYLYFTGFMYPLLVMRLSAADGTIVSQHQL